MPPGLRILQIVHSWHEEFTLVQNNNNKTTIEKIKINKGIRIKGLNFNLPENH